jgi:prepilin-type N-terminal cleavage/methylation domain-containing protein
MNHMKKKNKGFTLIEVIIYVAISALILVGVVQFSWDIMGLGTKVEVQSQLTHEGRFVLERIEQEVRAAEDIFEDDGGRQSHSSEEDFNAGTHNQTQWDSSNKWLELIPAVTSGDFTAPVMTAFSPISWGPFAWVPNAPYGKQLPDSSLSETKYASGNANMMGNVLLMHMNESSGSCLWARG